MDVSSVRLRLQRSNLCWVPPKLSDGSLSSGTICPRAWPQLRATGSRWTRHRRSEPRSISPHCRLASG